MSVPHFGPSQRLETCVSYLDQNRFADTYNNQKKLYRSIELENNVAEEGQVILVRNTSQSTDVIPDAAGYDADITCDTMTEKEKASFLFHEMKKYRLGVNQIEKGVNAPHQATGQGWDISMIDSHEVLIKHTGHEPISRFQYIGVRFPTNEDMEAQARVWSSRSCRGLNVSKFATYPVSENYEENLSKRFDKELEWIKHKVDRDIPDMDNMDGPVEESQVPALVDVVRTVLHAYTKIGDKMDRAVTALNSCTFNSKECIADREMNEFMKELCLKNCDFVSSLRPPKIIAQVNEFKSVNPHAQRVANCGDTMKCTLRIR
jgi:hypothetical protein